MSAPAVDLGALFDGAQRSVVRVETLPYFEITDEDRASWESWQRGLPRPERSVLTDDYLRLDVAPAVARGVAWERFRLVSEELTDYERWELHAYRENAAVGDRTWLVGRAQAQISHGVGTSDYWLIDDQHLVVQQYDSSGRWQGNRLGSEAELQLALRELDVLRSLATPLNEYLAGAGLLIPAARSAS